jgi:3-hydroxyacyl-CoA dehydrogenase/enoyl-CoA hydratase/3-hydroxybutyryl-CoA epimerase
MLGEGIPAAAIENAGIQCGMPVGPLAVMDETSLSLSVHVMEQTQADYEPRARPTRRRPAKRWRGEW